MASILLSDDHSIVRHAVKTIIEGKSDYSIVGEAGDANETLSLIEDKHPDLLILDLALPGKSGVEVIYELSQKNAPTKVVVLTMFEDESKIRQSFAAGAKAYLLKDSSPEELLSALEAVLNGGLYLPTNFEHLRKEVEELSANTGRSSVNHVHDPLAKLSKREREVFYLLADGKPNRVIARQLFISPRTVETHRARVIKKLGFDSTADLIRYAIRHNLLTL